MGKHIKHKMRDTSISAYAEVLETLGERQSLVFKKLRELKFASNYKLSKSLGLPVNQIVPRIYEMRKMGVVIFYKKEICPETKKTVVCWKPRFSDI